MGLSKQHKVYLAAAAVAALGLALDRTVFKPTNAVAVSFDEYAVDSISETSADTAGQELRDAERSLANRLKSVASERKVDPLAASDMFTENWSGSKTVAALPAGPSEAAAFVEQHRLTAVMGSGQSGYAIIDGKCIRVSQSIDGCTLISVTNRSAVFQTAQGQQFEYPLGH